MFEAQQRVRVGRWALTFHMCVWLTAVVAILGPVHQVASQTSDADALERAERLHDAFLQKAQEGHHDDAIALGQQVLEIRRGVLGDEHPDTIAAINNLAFVHHMKGDFERAEILYTEALTISRKVVGPQHPDNASIIENLASLHKDRGDFKRAEALYTQALQIWRLVLGEPHPVTLACIASLADLSLRQYDFERAEPLFLKVLTVRRQTLGATHPDTTLSVNNLAYMYLQKGELDRAAPLFQDALQQWREALGPTHPDTLIALNNVALTAHASGDFERAEALYTQALQARRETLGNKHPDTALSIGNMALFYHTQGDHKRAEPLFLEALKINREALGDQHPMVAASIDNLASLYSAQGDHKRAEPLFLEALKIKREVLGDKHRDVATTLNNLGAFYLSQRDLKRAAPLLEEGLGIRREVLGDLHPDVAVSIGNLAALNSIQGDHERAHRWRRQQLDIENNRLSLMLSIGSERQKTAYLHTLTGSTNGAVSALLDQHHAPAAQLALETVLIRKGRALDAQSSTLRLIRQGLGADAAALLDQLVARRAALARLSLHGPGKQGAQPHQQRLAQLREETEVLEEQLGRASARFAADQSPITVQRVATTLPPGAALLEWVAYKSVRYDDPGEPWSERQYGVFMLNGEGDIKWAKLGAAAPIDAQIAALRAEVMRCLTDHADPQGCDWQANARDVAREAQKLDAMVLAPLREHLEGLQHLYLAPDGQLNLLPFELLVDPQGRHLIETHLLTYLNSGRELVTHQLVSASKGPPLLIGDPDFERAEAASSDSPRARQARSGALGSLSWLPLPGTAREVETLHGLLPGATLTTKGQATEHLVKSSDAPHILHIATHGFFLADQPAPASHDARGFKLTQGPVVLEGAAPSVARLENPLLRSGLVLAGANNLQGGQDEDGVLTAAEVAGLNLLGTQLVVLSACETALGESRIGEGVYGLRRALALAGAESMVMSLWQVSDAATEAIMVNYYERLLAGEGRSEALRNARLALLSSPQWSHPYFWAAFISSGRASALQDTSPWQHAPAPATEGHKGGCAGCSTQATAPPTHAMLWLALFALLALRRTHRLTMNSSSQTDSRLR